MGQCRKVLFDMCSVVRENAAIVSKLVLDGYSEKPLADLKAGEDFLDKSEAGINAYINAFNNNSEKQIVVSGIPSYDEMVNGYLGDYLL